MTFNFALTKESFSSEAQWDHQADTKALLEFGLAFHLAPGSENTIIFCKGSS